MMCFFVNTHHGRYREASIQAHVCGNRCFLISCSTLKSANSFCLWYRPANTNTEFVCLCVRACVSGDNYFRIRSIPPCTCTKKKCTRSAVLRSIDAALLLCFKRCKIEMKINDSRLSTRTHWCPLMAIERPIQMAPLECVAEGWFYRAAQRFVRSGASQWWMKQMMELSDFLWSSLTDWRHISVRKKKIIELNISSFLSGWVCLIPITI